MKQKLKRQQEEEKNNQLINDNEEPEILRIICFRAFTTHSNSYYIKKRGTV